MPLPRSGCSGRWLGRWRQAGGRPAREGAGIPPPAARPGAPGRARRAALTQRAQVLLEILVGQHLPVPGKVDRHFRGRLGPDRDRAGGSRSGFAERSGWWAARKCAPSGGRGSWGGDSWIASAHKASGRIHRSCRSSPLSGAGPGMSQGQVVPGPPPPRSDLQFPSLGRKRRWRWR